jgi:uncharacterized protein (DUF433 family)
MTTFVHIEANLQILGGKPCIKGTRISVAFILELIASGATVDDIIRKYSHLSKDAVREAILYAAQFNKNEIQIEIGLAS